MSALRNLGDKSADRPSGGAAERRVDDAAVPGGGDEISNCVTN